MNTIEALENRIYELTDFLYILENELNEMNEFLSTMECNTIEDEYYFMVWNKGNVMTEELIDKTYDEIEKAYKELYLLQDV